MPPVIARSRSRKVNGYVEAVLALEAVRRKREDGYARYVQPLDRRRDRLAVEVDRRLRALIGTQLGEARRTLDAIKGGTDHARSRAEGERPRHTNREVGDDHRGASGPPRRLR
jgi:hypothetical protein